MWCMTDCRDAPGRVNPSMPPSYTIGQVILDLAIEQ